MGSDLPDLLNVVYFLVFLLQAKEKTRTLTVSETSFFFYCGVKIEAFVSHLKDKLLNFVNVVCERASERAKECP